MSKIKEKIERAAKNLPSDYRQVLNNISVNKAVKRIASGYNLNENEQSQLDREVTYLLLHIEDTPEFVTRLEDKLGWSEEKLADITESVTNKILRPLQEKLEESAGGNPDNVPVPKPPSQNDEPPKPDYGGRSDPYREPPE